jgi:hypothetical protein
MKRTVTEKYLEKAALLSTEEAEYFFSRMGKKLGRRYEDKKLIPVEALAIQLEVEDEKLKEWRERFTAIKANSKNK